MSSQKVAFGLMAALVAVGLYGRVAHSGGGKTQAAAGRYERVVFADEFGGALLGTLWKSYKSDSRIRDGVLVAIEPPDAGHNSVNSLVLPPQKDVEVSLSFKFEGARRFGVAFNDTKYKGSHAGHICRIMLSPDALLYQDDKTGIFKNEIWEKKQKGPLDEATQALLKTKAASFPVTLKPGQWYTLTVRTTGDLMTASIDGKPVGQLRSEGIAHATKDKPALVVSGREMHFDHLKISAP
jgi:hypothetical protein